MGEIHGWLCGPRLYNYDGWFFEFGYCGPWPLRKDGEPCKRAGRVFYKMFDRFSKEKNKEKFRVGGGCVRF